MFQIDHAWGGGKEGGQSETGCTEEARSKLTTIVSRFELILSLKLPPPARKPASVWKLCS